MPSRSAVTVRPPALPVHRGPFGPAEAERLLWRAGFGPGPGQAEQLANLGLDGAVRSLTRPASTALVGPEPRVDGKPLAPGDVWGHEGLWWLDRMIRTQAPLVERMTLVFHDWFATSVAAVPPDLMLGQNRTMRKHALGRFPDLFAAMTRDPAMLIWLDGVDNGKDAPNENYAREMLELFSLGAGRGYSERDVRETARALTGFRMDWKDGRPQGFRLDAAAHDSGVKTIFGHRGRYGWQDAVRLAVAHPRHPAYAVRRLWDHFIPVAPSAKDAGALATLYRASGGQVLPVVDAILRHPALHAGPRMVKPPVVYVAGLLRAVGRGVDTDAWSWLCGLTGQRLFEPPNVAGWDADRWIDTATWRGRWLAANYALEGTAVDDIATAEARYVTLTPTQAVDRALSALGRPSLTDATRAGLEDFATAARVSADRPWKVAPYAVLAHNALLMLIATSPDLHTS